MNIETAQSRINDQIRDEVSRRFGEETFDAIVQGHVLAGIESWFAPLLTAPKSKRAGKEKPCRTPMEVLGRIAKGAADFVESPSLQVQCGSGLMCATLELDLGIDTDERLVTRAETIFGPNRFACKNLEDLPPEPTYKTILVIDALGREAMKRRQVPVFHNFFQEAHRRLQDRGHLIVVDMDRFQDNIIEPLVALDHEIQDVMPIKPSGLTLVVTEK